MKNKFLLAMVLAAVAISPNCARKGLERYLGKGGFSIDYVWEKENLCKSGISPRIELDRVPRKTRMLEVKVEDMKIPSLYHGQGVLPYSGNDFIRENTLRSYIGPCPRPGEIRVYGITVIALDRKGKILSIARKFRECSGERKKIPD